MRATKNAVQLAIAFFMATLISAEEIYSIHGSGTTNPSKCFWNIMSRIEEQSHAFTRLTYRAVGSGTGQIEFLGDVNSNTGVLVPASDFGSGDIPLSQDDYDLLYNDVNGKSTAVHLPFVVSGVSFFHSVPNVPQGKEGLNLTSCLLAEIFNGGIDTWDDAKILAKNPNLKALLPRRALPIRVAHRVEGSSSTKSITQYLNMKCPDQWPDGQVNKKGKEIQWAPNALPCDSSGEMTTCIRGTEGTIGYLDAGHGWGEDLTEIELENKDGNFVSSLDSFRSGGTGVAATVATGGIESFDESFADVSLLDQTGRNTWPILVMSYVYVRTNIASFDSMTEDNLGLLRAFLEALYNPLYINMCKDFGFTPVPADVRTKALATMNEKIDWVSTSDKWTVEEGIEKKIGQGKYKISPKRRQYAEFERSTLTKDVASLLKQTNQNTADQSKMMETLAFLLEEDGRIQDLLKLLNKTDAILAQSTMKATNGNDDDGSGGSDADDRSRAALGLGAVSIALWGVALIYFLVTKFVLNM